MSVKLMAIVWDLSELSQSETLVALALADHADESGKCWPSIERIAEKARLKRRQTQTVIKRLEVMGLLSVERGKGRNQTSRYQFHVTKGAENAPLEKGAIYDTERVQSVTEKVQSTTLKGAVAIAPESPITIKEPPEEPPGLDREAWERFADYRRKIRKPFKPVSVPAAQRKLAGYGRGQAEVVEQTIANGWTGLFPLKDAESTDDPYFANLRRSSANH